MPVYNNPGFQQGVESLKQLFAPPSGQDAAAWAMANERNAEARRKAEAYARMTTAGATPALVDQFGVASGTFLPTQSYHALDVGDATTRRGQDLESSDRRYGVDVGARTSAANNAADNERAFATNAADNDRAIGQTKLQTLAGFFGPLGKDQVRPAVPSQLMTLFGGPGGDLPAAEGRRSPMSETEVKGAERQDLRGRGLLTDQDLMDAILGDKTPVEALGPGGKPVYMSPGAAVRTGAQPAPKSPTTVVNTGSDSSKFYDKADEARGKSFNDMADAGAAAQRSLIQIDELDKRLANVGTGGLAAMKQFAASYGLPVGDASDSQAADALINALIPSQRPPGSGSMSDGDVAMFRQSLPRIANQPNGNALIIRTMRGIAQYDAQRGTIANRVLNREISPADGQRAMAELPNPLAEFRRNDGGVETGAGATATPAAVAPANAGPQPGTVEGGYRFKGGNPADASSWERVN